MLLNVMLIMPLCMWTTILVVIRPHILVSYPFCDYIMFFMSESQSGVNLTSLCHDVKCPDLPHPRCRSVLPHGACCPLCGKS